MIQHDISSIFPLDGQQITETMESIRIYPFYGVSGPDLVCGGRPSDLAKVASPPWLCHVLSNPSEVTL